MFSTVKEFFVSKQKNEEPKTESPLLSAPINDDINFNSQQAHDYLKELARLTNKALPIIKNSTEGKDLTLVVGVTGSGKSTTINYLMGCEMQFTENKNGGTVIDAAPTNKITGKRYPKIGHTDQSETPFPEAFLSEEGINYTDCPGFADNHLGPEGVLASVSLEFAIKYAASIQAILVVIDYRALGVDRGVGFKHLSEILGQLLGDKISDHASSVFFVFTRALEQKGYNLVPVAANTIKKRLENSLPTMKEDLKNKHLSQEQRDLLITKIKMYELICQNEKNIISLDVMNPESRMDVVDRLTHSHLKPIPKNQFNFGPYDPPKRKLLSLSLKVATEGLSKLEQLQVNEDNLDENLQKQTMLEKTKNYNIQQIQNFEKQIKLLDDKQLSVTEKMKLQEESKQEQIETLRSQQSINQEQIQNLESAILKSEGVCQTFEAELKKLDVSTKELVWADAVYEERATLGWLAYTSKEFLYQGDKFDEVCLIFDKNEGMITVRQEKPTEGKYDAIYESYLGYNGKAKIEIFIEKRNKFAERIQQIKTNLSDKERDIKDHNIDVKSLRNKNERVIENKIKALEAKSSTSVKEQFENTLQNQSRKFEIENSIKELMAQNEKTDKEYAALENKNTALKQSMKILHKALKENKPVYDVLHQLQKVITFSNVIQKFLDEIHTHFNLKDMKQEKANSFKNPTDVKALMFYAKREEVELDVSETKEQQKVETQIHM